MPKIKDQDRAVAASEAVKKVIRHKNKLKEYRQELQQLPSLILTNGLGQTLAFYASKKDIHEVIGGQLAEFLTAGRHKDTKSFLDEIMRMEAGQYRHQTRQALGYAEWLKRYSKALIEEGG